MAGCQKKKARVQLCCLLVLTWCWTSLTSGGVAEHWTTSVWRRVLWEESAVSEYQAMVKGRSKVECVGVCSKHSYCSSFVFNAISSSCYLQPRLDSENPHAKHLGELYAKEDPLCVEENEPSVDGTITWTRTLTSLMGEVTCHEGYINTTSNWVNCMANTWESQVGCQQYLWINPPMTVFPVAIPVLPVAAGWSLCLEGKHTARTRFTVDLWINEDNRAFVIDFRFYLQQVVMVTMLNGAWGRETRPSVFPFVLDQPFHLKIKVTASGTYQVYADNTTYSYAVNSLLPVAEVKSVYVWNDVNVTRMDLMC